MKRKTWGIIILFTISLIGGTLSLWKITYGENSGCMFSPTTYTSCVPYQGSILRIKKAFFSVFKGYLTKEYNKEELKNKVTRIQQRMFALRREFIDEGVRHQEVYFLLDYAGWVCQTILDLLAMGLEPFDKTNGEVNYTAKDGAISNELILLGIQSFGVTKDNEAQILVKIRNQTDFIVGSIDDIYCTKNDSTTMKMQIPAGISFKPSKISNVIGVIGKLNAGDKIDCYVIYQIGGQNKKTNSVSLTY